MWSIAESLERVNVTELTRALVDWRSNGWLESPGWMVTAIRQSTPQRRRLGETMRDLRARGERCEYGADRRRRQRRRRSVKRGRGRGERTTGDCDKGTELVRVVAPFMRLVDVRSRTWLQSSRRARFDSASFSPVRPRSANEPPTLVAKVPVSFVDTQIGLRYRTAVMRITPRSR